MLTADDQHADHVSALGASGEQSAQSNAELCVLLTKQQEQITLLNEQLATMVASQEQLRAQHTQMAALIQQLAQPMEASVEIIDPSPEHAAGEDGPAHGPVATTTTSRRGLLKWGGLGAAAALAAAGATGLGHATAYASDGANLILGSSSNTAEHVTALTYNGSETAPTAFSVTTGVGVGVFATTGDHSTAIVAQAGGAPISTLNPFPTTVGVAGSANTAGSAGVWGLSDVGFGILGQTNGDGIDVAGVGSGRFYQAPMFAQGAPTTGSFMVGEQIRDKIGDLYIFVQHGSSGVWRRVAAGLPGLSGSVNFLANPIRLLDTRTGSPYAAGSVHSVQVVGVVLDGRSIPQGVVGVIGNVTVVNPTSGGDLRLYPAASLPVTSTINFAAGQIIANGVTVGLDSNGRLNIKVDMASGAHTDVLFDASGFIL